MNYPIPHPASFRDPSGHVYVTKDGVFRTVTDQGAAAYEAVRATGLLARFVERGVLLPFHEIEPAQLASAERKPAYLLEHPRIPFISYPYEWSFSALRAAALLHLDLQIEALAKGVVLSDASAFNVQFQGARPVFIDHLSFRPYREGELWAAHKQFCDQFLNPLLLFSLTGVPFHEWYRGSVEGIPATALRPLLPFRRKFNWTVLTHVVLQARLQPSEMQTRKNDSAPPPQVRYPKAAYLGMLNSLRRFIAKLRKPDSIERKWAAYSRTTSYSDAEAERKAAFVQRFCAAAKPGLLYDMGCNDGSFARIALASGANSVVGFEQDPAALDNAFCAAQAENMSFLPLRLDLANPSPDQGLTQTERQGLAARGPANALIALAVIHHLAIARNIPLARLVAWLVTLAPRGVVEFVPKEDPMVKMLLRHRDDIFPDYDYEHFETLMRAQARVVQSEIVSDSGRTLLWYEAA